MAQAPIRIVPQGEIAGGLSEPPAFLLPDAKSPFADRAARFDALAAAGAGEPAFMQLMGDLARAQQVALDSHPKALLPDAAHLERCHLHGLPPLGTDGPLGPAWRGALQVIASNMSRAGIPDAARRTLQNLANTDAGELDVQASRLLSLDYPALDAATVPFLGAALQVHWVVRAAALGTSGIRKLDVPHVCPVCGSPPVAGVLRIGVPVPGTRYLHCVLCATDWHLPRGSCSQCESSGKLAYYHIEHSSDTVKAEACDECRGYIKSLNQEKDPLADPVADDLATLPLDILLDESGYQRATPNFFFVPGQT